MSKLHEVIAAEGTRKKAAELSLEETRVKFAKRDLFEGKIRTLKLLNEVPGKEAQEQAESTVVVPGSNVAETLKYSLNLWAQSEDIRATKNKTNTIAKADLIVDGVTIGKDLPVDELMSLEAQMVDMKKLFSQIPTIDAKKEWSPSKKWPIFGLLETAKTSTVKTEKEIYPIIMAPATDKHPAQVKENTRTINVGTFEDQTFSTCMTTEQKAEIMARVDHLIVACRQARNRANDIEAIQEKVGTNVLSYLMGHIFNAAPASA